MTLLLLNFGSLNVTLSSVFMFGIIFILIVGWIIFTIIVRYHWKNYSTGGVELLRMNMIYLIGSGAIFTFMILSAFLYFLSS